MIRILIILILLTGCSNKQQVLPTPIGELKALDNICFQFSALECIFGIDWSSFTVKPWFDAAISILGI